MSYIAEGFSVAWHLLRTGDPETFSAIWVTLSSSFFAMGIALSVGIPCGFALGYCSFTGKRVVRLIVDSMLCFPTVVIGLLMYMLLSRRGPLGDWGLLFTIEGMGLALALLGLPIVIALTSLAVERIDTRLRETLQTLGADRKQLFMAVLHEVRFPLIGAAVAAFGRVVSEVGISMLVGGNIKWHTRTITTAISLETGKGEFAMGIALGIVLLGIAFTLNIALAWLRKRSEA